MDDANVRPYTAGSYDWHIFIHDGYISLETHPENFALRLHPRYGPHNGALRIDMDGSADETPVEPDETHKRSEFVQ